LNNSKGGTFRKSEDSNKSNQRYNSNQYDDEEEQKDDQRYLSSAGRK